MKKAAFRYQLLCLIWYSCLSLSAQVPEKIALLVGCGDYPASSGWGKLNAAGDIRIVSNALIAQGFQEKNIYSIREEEATRQGILTAIRELLIARARPGDIVFFHFSGHGQQVWDDNGDEMDGYDEAIVPYDSPKAFVKQVYEGERLIRDDELAALFRELRYILGKEGHLMVLMDACHSGSGTRGSRLSRGTDIIMADAPYIEMQVNQPESTHTLVREMADESTGMASMIAFFSCSPQETSWEYVDEAGNMYGLMSFAFSKCFSNLGQEATYRGLLDKIQVFVSAEHQSQTPQAEGDLDRRLLDGKILGRPDYGEVREILTSRSCQVNAGQLRGWNAGSTVVFFPVDVRDTAGLAPLAFGTVISADLLTSLVHLDRDLSDQQMSHSWVHLREMNYGLLKASLRIELPEGPLKEQLLANLPAAPYIELTGNNENLRLSLNTAKDSVELIANGGDLLIRWSVHAGSDRIVRACWQRTADWLRANFLRSIEMEDRDIRYAVTFLPAGNGQPYNDTNGLVQWQVGDTMRIQVENLGSKPFYFHILDIQPDHQVNLITGDRPASDCYLLPNAAWISPVMNIGLPAGREVLKIFATRQPLDLSQVIRSRGASIRSDTSRHHPLEILMAHAEVSGVSYRGEVLRMPAGAGAISSLVAWIVE